MNNIWYEVYEIQKIKTTNGIDSQTRTLEIAKTLTKAKNIYRKYLRSGLWIKKELGIDKWQDIDNPKCIGEVI